MDKAEFGDEADSGPRILIFLERPGQMLSANDRIEGYLEVGIDEDGQVVVNHPDLKPDENGVGHIVFSPNQARVFAGLLLKHADLAAAEELKRKGGRKNALQKRKGSS